MEKKFELRAMAKINLGLDVIRKREDGYHEVKMIMQTVRIFDRLTFQRKRTPGIAIQTNLSYLPVNENNLVYRAADLLMKECGLEKEGLLIRLQKYIPVAAGMAGGSSDAAAALIGDNRMFRLGFSLEELMERGVRLGADVPYCLMRGTALAEGIGEKLTRLPACPPCHILVAKPRISVSTKFVYSNLRADELQAHPDIDRQIEALENGDLKGVAEAMGNVLETVTIPAHPVIGEIKEQMMRGGALNAMMSGSGPTVFGIFTDPVLAEKTFQQLRRSRSLQQVYLTEPFCGK